MSLNHQRDRYHPREPHHLGIAGQVPPSTSSSLARTLHITQITRAQFLRQMLQVLKRTPTIQGVKILSL